MRRTVSLAAALLTAAASVVTTGRLPARAQPAPGFDERVGEVDGWHIGYSKSLAGCFAAATFTDQTTVWLGYGSKVQFYIAFTNAGWRSIETGKPYQLSIYARGYGRWNGRFVGFRRGEEPGVER